MNNLLYLVFAVGMSVVLSALLWLLNRKPRSIKAGMDEFNQMLGAIAPEASRPPGPSSGRTRRGPR